MTVSKTFLNECTVKDKFQRFSDRQDYGNKWKI